jgi:hypothetical protein
MSGPPSKGSFDENEGTSDQVAGKDHLEVDEIRAPAFGLHFLRTKFKVTTQTTRLVIACATIVAAIAIIVGASRESQLAAIAVLFFLTFVFAMLVIVVIVKIFTDFLRRDP